MHNHCKVSLTGERIEAKETERVGEVQERGRAERRRERKVAESRKKTSRYREETVKFKGRKKR